MTKMLTAKAPYPPGDFAIWIIIYVELLTFALLFLGFAFSRRSNIEMFNASQLQLDQISGFINTLILITSSYFVAKAVQSIKHMTDESIKETSRAAARWLLFAIISAGGFLAVKLLDFIHVFGQGITLSTNKFFMFYIMLTVFHFMHVLLGSFILCVIYQKTKTQGYTQNDHKGMETGASYWHMVDLLWIVLFPLIYIIR
ncbi:MAG TPA: cytochrome-c oxidase [Sulfurovum sp. UBA12169]|nr:MAG TPA: cytochrome-c oxidase [Sulfurovum sp. UBA12169]